MKPLLLTLLLGGSASAADLTIRFLDVGQGDAILITSPEGKTALYDGGRSEPRLRELLGRYGVRSLDLMVASHADADHITGLLAAAPLRPKFFVNNGIAGTTQTFSKLVAALQAAGTQGLIASDRTINLGGVKLRLLPPPPGMPKTDQNLNSVGLLIEFGKFRSLMTGDSETAETAAWLKKYPASTLGPVDVYKSIHHGARNGDNAAWLAAVRPKNVVIGVGANNYGHPTSEAIALYAKANANIFRTDLNGTVMVTVKPDGSYTIKAEKGLGTARSTAPVTPVPASSSAPPPAPRASVSFVNCTEARGAGYSNIRKGEPGYAPKLDRDGDGIACER